MKKFNSLSANEFLKLALYCESVSMKADKKMKQGKIEPEKVLLFQKMVNDIAGELKVMIGDKSVELLEIQENKRLRNER